MKKIIFSIFTLIVLNANAQVKKVPLGTTSAIASAPIQLQLTERHQSYTSKTSSKKDQYDTNINSPKSVTFTKDGSKYYVQSLEGCETVVYNAKSHLKLKVIKHKFGPNNAFLFKDGASTVFDYKFADSRKDPNTFLGKPVESCLTADGKYLLVTYYRRSYDSNAQYPSALAIINTATDEIVRVMPTGPLPKMLAASSDGKYIAVTHWGDNTIGIMDVSQKDPNTFKFIKLLEADHRIDLSAMGNGHINRDTECGNCLRGTAFSNDSKYLLIGKMSSNNGIAVFNTSNFENVGNINGLKSNLRHLIIKNNVIYTSANKSGYVEKFNWTNIEQQINKGAKDLKPEGVESVFVGAGARTIGMTHDGKYIFAAVNNECKISIVDIATMKMVNSIPADPYPVGLAVAPDDKSLIVTSQGNAAGGGNSVMIYTIKK